MAVSRIFSTACISRGVPTWCDCSNIVTAFDPTLNLVGFRRFFQGRRVLFDAGSAGVSGFATADRARARSAHAGRGFCSPVSGRRSGRVAARVATRDRTRLSARPAPAPLPRLAPNWRLPWWTQAMGDAPAIDPRDLQALFNGVPTSRPCARFFFLRIWSPAFIERLGIGALAVTDAGQVRVPDVLPDTVVSLAFTYEGLRACGGRQRRHHDVFRAVQGRYAGSGPSQRRRERIRARPVGHRLAGGCTRARRLPRPATRTAVGVTPNVWNGTSTGVARYRRSPERADRLC